MNNYENYRSYDDWHWRVTRRPDFVPIPALRKLYQPHPHPVPAVLNTVSMPVPATSQNLYTSPHHHRTITAHRDYFSRHGLVSVNL